MADVIAPNFTGSVNQQFFIESQGGSQNPISYLDRFPDTVYTKSIDSVLVSFLYALLGPVGVGQLAEEYLEARLEIEDAGISGSDLDALYTSPFTFARLAEETYTTDAQAALLPAVQRAAILAQDASFRNRAQEFLKGARAGGTLRGIKLVAKSGLNRSVDVIENYTALFDQYTDYPLGVALQGTTPFTNEIILLPRQEVPSSSLQIIGLGGQPVSGWFTLIFPSGPAYQVIPITTVNGSSIITVPDSSLFPSGVYVSLTATAASSDLPPSTPVMYAMSGGPITGTTVQLEYPPNSGSAGNPYAVGSSPGTGTFLAYVGNTQTTLLPYNATASDVQTALIALPTIGNNNVSVTGGPLPNTAISIQFQNNLSDTDVPTCIVNMQPDPIVGVTSGGSGGTQQMIDAFGNVITITASVNVDVVGVSADSQTSAIDPQDQQAALEALSQIQPVTSVISMAPAPGTTIRQESNEIFAGSNYTEVLRFVTGNATIQWPPTDSVHWMVSGVEEEAVVEAGDTQQSYQGFHNIANAYAYTEAALLDPSYSSDPITGVVYGGGYYGVGGYSYTDSVEQPVWNVYWDTMIGLYSNIQTTLYPFLATYQDPSAQYPASQAPALEPEPLILTSTVNGVGIINRCYPSDYLGAPGAPALALNTPFWSSAERNAGVDYLELDLGTCQVVNFIYFEATSKPYLIDVAYDILDMAPQRTFIPVTYVPDVSTPSILSLAYSAVSSNAWTPVSIYVSNSLGLPIYTRFIRIGFTKNPGSSPFAVPLAAVTPYSIEVRNLRLGRAN